MRVLLKHERLAKEIASSRLSQNAWALRLGLESSHFSKLVNGRRPYPSATTRAKLLEGLGLDFDELFEIEREASPSSRRQRQKTPLGPTLLETQTRRFEVPIPRLSLQALFSQPHRGEPMSNIVQEFRFACRLIRRNPEFTFVAILTLALGIGLNSAMFSLVNAVLFRPLPVADPERLVAVYSRTPTDMLDYSPLSYPDFIDLRDRCSALDEMLGYATTSLALDLGDQSALITAETVTGNYFSALGVRPVLGRGFSPEEDGTRGTHPVAVLSHRTWLRRFGGRSDALDRTVRLNGIDFNVIGVAPRGFTGLFRGLAPELWIPLAMKESLHAPHAAQIQDSEAPPGTTILDDRRARWVLSLGRLASGISVEQARAQLSSIGEELRERHPETNKDREYLALPAANIRILPDVDSVLRGGSFVLMAMVGLVLLIASANVANMLLARAAGRRREVAIRLSVGATRARLLRQLLIESFVLALLAGGLALLLTALTNSLLNKLSAVLPLPVEVTLQLSVDRRVLAFTFAACLLTTLFFGLAPALRAARSNLVDGLRRDSQGPSRGFFSKRFGSALVVAQISLSLLLLICAGLTLRSLLNAHRIDPGFDPERVVMGRFTPDLVGYDDQRAAAFYEHLQQEMKALPGVESVATASHLPLSFEINVEKAVTEPDRALPLAEWLDVDAALVGPGYFETMRTPILRGRSFTEQDAQARQRVAVANQRLAELLWPGQDAIGRRLVLEPDGEPYEIVGVAVNGLYRTLGEETRPFLYRDIEQTGSGDRLVLVRTAGDEEVVLTALRKTVRNYDGKIPAVKLQPVTQSMETSLLLPEIAAGLFGLFGLLGTLVACVGLYGLIAYMVSRRTREIGIRMAVGAGGRDILRLVLGRGLTLVATGVLVGVGAALLTTRVLSALLYGISASDPATYGLVIVLLMAVALLACLIPARRAKNLDPNAALRCE